MNDKLIGQKSSAARKTGYTVDLIIVAVFSILAGLAEVVTSFTHNFFGITTSSQILFNILSALVGVMYACAGMLLLTRKKQAALIAIFLLCADVAGRIGLVLAGWYPLNTPKNVFSIVAGTLIVALVGVYAGWKRKSFN